MTGSGFLCGAGGYLFQGILGHRLNQAEFGYVNTATAFVNLLGLPLAITAYAVVHHIARFRASGDDSRLKALLVGSRSFLLRLTVIGCLVGVLVVRPLSVYFNFPRAALTLMSLVYLLFSIWSIYFSSLCQGLAWFARLAVLGVAVVIVRVVCVFVLTARYSHAEAGLLANALGALSTFVVLFWGRELFVHGNKAPVWTGGFFVYLVVAAANVGGGFCFTQGDLLVAQRHLPRESAGLGDFSAAGLLARALWFVSGPVLTVVFVARSGQEKAAHARNQFSALGVYAAALIVGAACLYLVRDFALKLLGKYSPAASAMILPLAVTMVFVGLIQAVGIWALASRWLRLAVLYGALGVAYWCALLVLGTSLPALLNLMPTLTGICFVALLLACMVLLRK